MRPQRMKHGIQIVHGDQTRRRGNFHRLADILVRLSRDWDCIAAHFHVNLRLIYSLLCHLPHRAEALSDDARLTSVCCVYRA